MKKILFGFLGIMMVVAVVASSARALFFSTVNINNVAISSGNANLEFSLSSNGPWTSDFTFVPWIAENIAPGYENHATFYVRNNSSADIDLKLSALLKVARGDWGPFNLWTTVWVGDSTGTTGSGYHTLTEWATTPGIDLGITVPHGGTPQAMGLYLKVSIDADNSFANKWISTDWTITGTQTP
jgi:hypothetical protein